MATCLAWISALALVVVTFLGAAVSIGWIIGGALVLAMVAAVIVMFKEVGRATELPDYLEEIILSPDAADRLAYSRRDFRSIEAFANRAVITSRDLTTGGYERIRPRRASARQDRPRVSSRS